MGIVVSTLRDNICTCFGRIDKEKKDIETNYITPKATQAYIEPDIEPDTSNLDYTTNNMYDMRNLKYSTLDDHELNTRIRYYVLTNGKRIHMI